MKHVLVLIGILVWVGCEDEGVGARPTGAPCSWGLQCVGGVCIGASLAGEATGWTGGMCSERCPDGLCPETGFCTDLGDGLYCLPACAESADCREGYVCSPAAGVCLPDCTRGWDCGEALQCFEDGLCRMDLPELTSTGGPSVRDSDCAEGWCLAEAGDGADTGWVGGTCTVPCGPGGICPPTAGCMVLGGEGWCLARCGGPDTPSCREGYLCDPFIHVCLPHCDNPGWECGPTYVCAPDGVCMPAPPPGGGG